MARKPDNERLPKKKGNNEDAVESETQGTDHWSVYIDGSST